jgi:hypothetical protein
MKIGDEILSYKGPPLDMVKRGIHGQEHQNPVQHDNMEK